MFAIIVVFCIYLNKNNSVRDFSSNNKTMLLKNKRIFCKRFLCFDSNIEYFYRRIQYFSNKDYKRLC